MVAALAARNSSHVIRSGLRGSGEIRQSPHIPSCFDSFVQGHEISVFRFPV